MDKLSKEKPNMSYYNDTFNFVFGMVNKDVDLFNNRYIEFRVNEVTPYGVSRKDNIKLKKCDKEKDLMKFMPEKTANYYPNSLCFEDLS